MIVNIYTEGTDAVWTWSTWKYGTETLHVKVSNSHKTEEIEFTPNVAAMVVAGLEAFRKKPAIAHEDLTSST